MLAGFLILAAVQTLMSLMPYGFSAYGWLTTGAVAIGVGMELVVPPSNNASLTLAPNKVAAIARLRGTFRQDSNLRTRLRRALLCWPLNCTNMLREGPVGRVELYRLRSGLVGEE
jgi:hypothetical protein